MFSPGIARVKRQVSAPRSAIKNRQFFVAELPTKGPNGEGVGIAIKGGVRGGQSNLGLYISEIVEGGTAHQSGQLMKNDRIVRINDMDIRNVDNNSAMALLEQASQQPEIRLMIQRGGIAPAQSRDSFVSDNDGSMMSLNYLDNSQTNISRNSNISATSLEDELNQNTLSSQSKIPIQMIELPVTDEGFGIRCEVLGGKVVVSSLHPTGSVARDGRILRGAELVAVGNVRLEGNASAIEQAMAMGCDSTLNTQQTVALPHSGRQLGITLSGGVDSAEGGLIRIASIQTGSAAAEGERLQIGDGILTVDTHTLVGASINKAKSILSRSWLRRDVESTILRVQTEFVQVMYRAPDPTLLQLPHHEIIRVPSVISRSLSTYSMALDGEAHYPLDDLIQATNANSGLSLNEERAIKSSLRPNSAGMVRFQDYTDAAVNILGRPPFRAISAVPPSSSVGAAAAAANPLPDSLQTQQPASLPVTPSARRAVDIPMRRIEASSIDDMGDNENERLKRENDLLKQRLAILDKELSDRTSQATLASAAQHSARAVEADYEEIVALLEAEVAHLRSQLNNSPDKKDKQLINLRRRVVVLGCQLNKAVASRNNYQFVNEKLMLFVRNVIQTLKNVRTNPGGAAKRLNLKSNNKLRHRPSDGPLPPSAEWSVGDVCQAPWLSGDNRYYHAVIKEIKATTHRVQDDICVVEFLEFSDLPPLEEIEVNLLKPLNDTSFAAKAGRGQVAPRAGGRPNESLPGYLSATEDNILAEAEDVLRLVQQILERHVLPFGWEEAFTPDGKVYYIDHVTQSTSWSHPDTKVHHHQVAHTANEQETNIDADQEAISYDRASIYSGYSENITEELDVFDDTDSAFFRQHQERERPFSQPRTGTRSTQPHSQNRTPVLNNQHYQSPPVRHEYEDVGDWSGEEDEALLYRHENNNSNRNRQRHSNSNDNNRKNNRKSPFYDEPREGYYIEDNNNDDGYYNDGDDDDNLIDFNDSNFAAHRAHRKPEKQSRKGKGLFRKKSDKVVYEFTPML